MTLETNAARAEQLLQGMGYQPRTITHIDDPVTLYDQAVSVAAESDGYLTKHHIFFVYTVPSQVEMRLASGMIPRIKLVDSGSAELPAGTTIMWGVHVPDQPIATTWFGIQRYTYHRAVGIGDQLDTRLNEKLALIFENDFQKFDLFPGHNLVIAVSGTATLLDVDDSAFSVEFEAGFRRPQGG